MKKKILLLIILVIAIMFTGCGKKETKDFEKKLVSFTYSFGKNSSGYNDYSIISSNDVVKFIGRGTKNDFKNFEYEIDKSYLDELDSIIQDNKIYEWNGFSKEGNEVQDGYGFSIQIGYDDGTNYSANGYMMYPDNYDEIHIKIVNYLKDLKKKATE